MSNAGTCFNIHVRRLHVRLYVKMWLRYAYTYFIKGFDHICAE